MLHFRDMIFQDMGCDWCKAAEATDQVDESGTPLKAVRSSCDMSRTNCLRYVMLQQTINAVGYATMKMTLHGILLSCVTKQYCHSLLAWADVAVYGLENKNACCESIGELEHLSTWSSNQKKNDKAANSDGATTEICQITLMYVQSGIFLHDS